MANNIPQKTDIEAIFQRLRAQATNKTCFDCSAKNPTWASVTYGVFICIDCSAVHRSLGVHLTFVRSTNLDTNWTWTQIRQMQLSGNANASQFFRQHNCNTTDAQQKYNSRAAQLYRDKLANSAQQAMKTHGTSLYLDAINDQTTDLNEKKEEDFFAECSTENNDLFNVNNSNQLMGTSQTILPSQQTSNKATTPKIGGDLNAAGDGNAPSTDFLNFTEPLEVKPTIGVRKIQPKRGMAGSKKLGGLGATKVKTNFADLEQRANLADQQKFTVTEKKHTVEEEAETMASVRLAYQDLSIQANKEEAKLKQIDPAKAKQMERLGMGFNVRSGISHSALNDMTTINQESTPSKYSNKMNSSNSSSSSGGGGGGGGVGNDGGGSSLGLFDKEPKNHFFDDYTSRIYTSSKQDRELEMMGFDTIEPIESNKNMSSMFSQSSSGGNDNGGGNGSGSGGYKSNSSSISDQPSAFSNYYETSNNRSSGGGGGGGGAGNSNSKNNSSTKLTPGGTKYTISENDEAQKKFGSAKAISSDQFFNNEPSTFERSANMAKFQGANSISSADYFGDGSTTQRNSGRNMQYNGPDLEDVRESVRHGVTKVAGRLSSIATDMMSSLQDKYGN